MKHDEGTLETPAGASLYYQSWQPFDRPRAVLLIAHGLAEHSGRYQNFARFFVDRGYAVYALDHPGHGKSDGARCHIQRFSQFTDGVGLLLEKVREENPDTLVFLVGHSMGGLIATRFLIEHQSEFAGCVLSGAAVQPAVEVPALQRLTIRLLSIVLPKLGLLQLDASEISRDPEVVDRYRNDPLVFTGKVSARLLEQFFSAMTGFEEKLAVIELPMLILQGSADGLVSPQGSKMLHEKIGSRDKKLIIYEGLYHEIYNEPEQEDVMTDVADWLAPRLVRSAQS
jgi:alpha-beta hydrolase superfamily lysophospholipase